MDKSEKIIDKQDKGPFYKVKVKVPNPWLILGIFTLFYVGLSFLMSAGQEFFVTNIIKEENVTWTSYIITAAVIFGILFFIIRYSDISIVEFEHTVF